MVELTAFDRQILNAVQHAVPLVERPFAELGRRLNAAEDEVLDRLRFLKKGARIIRQISAIFDTRALGYQSALVAARYDDDHLDAGAAIVSEHPGVSHNYRRSHAYNLWYTVAVPPDSRLGLDGTIARLHELSGAKATRKMQTLKLFKIGVQLDVTGRRSATSQEGGPAYDEDDQREARSHPLSAADIAAIRALQIDLPLFPAPFEISAQQAGISATSLLEAGRRLHERRQMRRFAAVLRHREAGFAFNCMGVWNVPDDRVEQVGAAMARFDAVSHCYLRPRYDDWPYNVFSMIHGRSPQECRAVIESIAQATGVRERAELWTSHEYKKARLSYFTPEAAEWEARNA